MNTATIYLIFVPDTGYDIPDWCYDKIVMKHFTGDYNAVEQLQIKEMLRREVANLIVMLEDGCILSGVRDPKRAGGATDSNAEVGLEIILTYLKDSAASYLYKSIIGSSAQIPANMLVPISAKVVTEKFPLLFPGKMEKMCRNISSSEEIDEKNSGKTL